MPTLPIVHDLGADARPATIADLLDSSGLRRKSGMTDEQRAAAGERLQASRNRVEA